MKLDNYIRKILNSSVYDVASQTPLHFAKNLSVKLNNQIYLKREDKQPVYSFKIRGAYNKIASLSKQEQAKGIITASAGNHAQGVALSAKHLNLDATIVMPITTPTLKVNAVKSYGAKVVLFGDAFPQALQHSLELVEKEGFSYIHPYDDEEVIAGQGTIAMEILQQHRNTDYIFVPVGGGGLVAGILAYVKYVNPHIKVIAVESNESACLYEALKANSRITLPKVGLFADGVAVSQIGEKTFEICKNYIDDAITVSVDEICAAIKDIYNETRSITEPSGAIALAGIKKYLNEHNIQDKSFVAINSGANIDFNRLKHIAERTEIGEKTEAIFAVKLNEEKGAFKNFCEFIGKRAITEFNYRFNDKNEAFVFVGVNIQPEKGETKEVILEYLQQQYQVFDLSNDEISLVHIRHMVGGRARVENERIFSFEFPERPGALLDFLNTLSNRWNISLFHYRNHSAAYGRVLVGIQVDKGESDFMQALQDINYPFIEQTNNIACELFIK